MDGGYITSEPVNFKGRYIAVLLFFSLGNILALLWFLGDRHQFLLSQAAYILIWTMFNIYSILIIISSTTYFPSLKHLMVYTCEHSKFTFNRKLDSMILFGLAVLSIMIMLFDKSILSGLQFFFLASIMFSPIKLSIFSTEIQNMVKEFKEQSSQ